MARITRYTPGLGRDDFLWPMSRLHQEMNRLFSDAFRGFDEGEESVAGRWAFAPVVDVDQQDDRYEITMELPGVTLNDVNVEMSDDMLVISGSKERKTTTGSGDRRQAERIYGSFRRAFRLPDDAVEDNIGARFADGVLTVSIPRSAEQARLSSRRIQIEDASGAAKQAKQAKKTKQGQSEPSGQGGEAGA